MTVHTALQLLGPSTGGIRRHVGLLAGALPGLGVEAPVVGPAGVMEGLGAQAGVVRVPDGMKPAALLRARRDLRPFRAGADVVHVHGLKAAFVAIAGRPRRPLVQSVHNVVLQEFAGRSAAVQHRLERLVFARADRVIASTDAMAATLQGVVRPDRLRVALPVSAPPEVWRPGPEVRAAIGVSPDAPMAVCVGRLHPQKDLVTLLVAWSAVHSALPEARLVLVGEGPQRRQLEELCADPALGGSAILAGNRPHAIDEIAAADVAVLTSVWEGVPLVLAEAMQLGVPMVSTPVGLAPQLLTGDSGGTVVPFADPPAVAEALIVLLGDPARAAAVGKAGRAVAEDVFDPQRAVARILAVYNEVA